MELSGNKVVIRFPAEIAFPAGSDSLTPAMLPILDRVTAALADSPGTVMVAGHTDNVPIKSQAFGSNWELSTDRAVSVVHQILELGNLTPDRIRAVGYGDTKPVAPNDTPENRAMNRRVEIVIEQELTQ